MAFLPVEVLLVTFVLHRLLQIHEKRSLLKKMNMVIGAFFSVVGHELLRHLGRFCPQDDALRSRLAARTNPFAARAGAEITA